MNSFNEFISSNIKTQEEVLAVSSVLEKVLANFYSEGIQKLKEGDFSLPLQERIVDMIIDSKVDYIGLKKLCDSASNKLQNMTKFTIFTSRKLTYQAQSDIYDLLRKRNLSNFVIDNNVEGDIDLDIKIFYLGRYYNLKFSEYVYNIVKEIIYA